MREKPPPDQLCSKLEFSRIKSSRNRTEVPSTSVEADAAIVYVSPELGVISGIESIRAKLEPASTRLADQEALE